jgi:hypothetical protein
MTANQSRIARLATFAMSFLIFTTTAFAQKQFTITCPDGYWDTLSFMMLDPGLSAGYHMEGTQQRYTTWDQAKKTLYYVKASKGFPWDINLYDSSFIYQWVTEITWSDPKTNYKAHDNASGSATSKLSLQWAARCAIPGGAGSTIWNPPYPHLPNNTNIRTVNNCQTVSDNHSNTWRLMELKSPSTYTIIDHRTSPATTVPISVVPLQYTWNCSSQNVNSCTDREIFDYGQDTDAAHPNPVDGIRHTYGWVRWRLYHNQAPSGQPANWVQVGTSTVTNELTSNTSQGEGTPDFPCGQ